ncbi:MAG: hypothetical protein U0975_13470 [Erythrobacter sp.]|nr:hypothetical protein [Erythrobacter sp.]
MALFRFAYDPAYFMIFADGPAMLVSSGAAPMWLGALMLAPIAVSLVAKRVPPFARHWNQNHSDTRRGMAHALFNGGSILILYVHISLTYFASHRIPLLWRFNCVYHSLRCSSDYPTDYFEQLIETFRPAGPVTSKDAKASAGLQQ